MEEEHTDNQNFDWLDEPNQLNQSPNDQLKEHINQLVAECLDPDNFMPDSASYKKQIYQMKCWIEEIYAILPKFEEEKQWEKERIFDKLKGPDDGFKKRHNR